MEIDALSDFEDKDFEYSFQANHTNWNGREIQLLNASEEMGIPRISSKDNPILCMSRPSRMDVELDIGCSDTRGFYAEGRLGASWGGSDRESSSHATANDRTADHSSQTKGTSEHDQSQENETSENGSK